MHVHTCYILWLSLTAGLAKQLEKKFNRHYSAPTDASIIFEPSWPTLENGDHLLRASNCTEELNNCNSRGVCAEHFTGIVCFCYGTYYGKTCEQDHSQIPSWLVLGLIGTVLVAYFIVLKISACSKSSRCVSRHDHIPQKRWSEPNGSFETNLKASIMITPSNTSGQATEYVTVAVSHDGEKVQNYNSFA